MEDISDQSRSKILYSGESEAIQNAKQLLCLLGRPALGTCD